MASCPREGCVNRSTNIDCHQRHHRGKKTATGTPDATLVKQISVLLVLTVMRLGTNEEEPHASGGATDHGSCAAATAEETKTEGG